MPREPKPGCFMYGDLDVLKNSIGIDNVNAPYHYNRHGSDIDCLKALKASMSKEQYIGLLKGSAMQYLWRFDLKGGLEDLQKAEFYLKELIQEYS